MKVYEGDILTCDEKRSVKKFLVEDRGKIAYTGDALPELYAAAERISLGKGALCPAFADTHIHFMSHALFLGGKPYAPGQGKASLVARGIASRRRI